MMLHLASDHTQLICILAWSPLSQEQFGDMPTFTNPACAVCLSRLQLHCFLCLTTISFMRTFIVVGYWGLPECSLHSFRREHISTKAFISANKSHLDLSGTMTALICFLLYLAPREGDAKSSGWRYKPQVQTFPNWEGPSLEIVPNALATGFPALLCRNSLAWWKVQSKNCKNWPWACQVIIHSFLSLCPNPLHMGLFSAYTTGHFWVWEAGQATVLRREENQGTLHWARLLIHVPAFLSNRDRGQVRMADDCGAWNSPRSSQETPLRELLPQPRPWEGAGRAMSLREEGPEWQSQSWAVPPWMPCWGCTLVREAAT